LALGLSGGVCKSTTLFALFSSLWGLHSTRQMITSAKIKEKRNKKPHRCYIGVVGCVEALK